jgi:hypothetical protein
VIDVVESAENSHSGLEVRLIVVKSRAGLHHCAGVRIDLESLRCMEYVQPWLMRMPQIWLRDG